MRGRGAEFAFKRFVIRQQRATMRVSTDTVLLGAWAPLFRAETAPEKPFRALDVGCGTSAVALMVAQRLSDGSLRSSPSRGTPLDFLVDAVEADGQTAAEAEENTSASPFSEHVRVHHARIQDLLPVSGKGGGLFNDYDLVVSNPPFFSSGASRPPERGGQARAGARVSSNSTLSFDALCGAASHLLRPGGTLAVVVPVGMDGEDRMARCGQAKDLGVFRRTFVFPIRGKPAKRVLMAFRKGAMEAPHSSVDNDLIIAEPGSAGGPRIYTTQFRELTEEFYLPEHFAKGTMPIVAD
jgi:tRNA1Val (adenine37-N6)-methyltransferase